ncbi:hypothetical protein GPJ56_004277 [Histomonas meleagridis]|uniref:uncharacterized protein n=1 Tax=Histomonas meleagridis TaxID=135588 RepID=UPI00355A5939|nr:hypothetical protein GPJ56_004277 [Histomonas meleagridis]KAH0800509.1 hypothetical protein GO595_006712 [Histomonas meleagridis]
MGPQSDISGMYKTSITSSFAIASKANPENTSTQTTDPKTIPSSPSSPSSPSKSPNSLSTFTSQNNSWSQSNSFISRTNSISNFAIASKANPENPENAENASTQTTDPKTIPSSPSKSPNPLFPNSQNNSSFWSQPNSFIPRTNSISSYAPASTVETKNASTPTSVSQTIQPSSKDLIKRKTYDFPHSSSYQIFPIDSTEDNNLSQTSTRSKYYSPIRKLHTPRKQFFSSKQKVQTDVTNKFNEWVKNAYEDHLLSPIQVSGFEVKMYLIDKSNNIPFEFYHIDFDDFKTLLLNEIEKRKQELNNWSASTSNGIEISELDKKANEIIKEKQRIDFLADVCYCLPSNKKDKQNQRRIRTFAPPLKLKL